MEYNTFMNDGVQKKLNLFFSQFKDKAYKKREILVRAGDEPTGLFFLKNGVVRQYTITPEGEELNLNTFKAASMFPVGWIVNDASGQYFFEALSDCEVYIAPKSDALKFLKSEPGVLFDLVQRIYRGLDGYFVKIEQSMTGSAQSKLIIELIVLARRFGKKLNKSTRIELKLTERDLGSQSGIARETVSREMKKLKQKGLVNFQKNMITIKDLELLEEQLLI